MLIFRGVRPIMQVSIRPSALLTCLLAIALLAGTARATELVLENGWIDASPALAAEAFVDDGIVHLKGAIRFGSTEVLFTLPPGMRPATDVYVTVDQLSTAEARLWIRPNGVAILSNPLAFNPDYSSFYLSLDGARFALSAAGFTALPLANGWVGAPFSTSAPAARLIDGIVHLKGAVANGTTNLITTLPVGMRPEATVYLEVNLCTAHTGVLIIQPDGTASVVANTVSGGNLDLFGRAQCFTSLDGVSFAPSSSGFTPVAIPSGWTNAPGTTSPVAVSMVDGIVRFKGAFASDGTGLGGFQLPPAMRPADDISIPIDDCEHFKAYLYIQSNGLVSMQAGGFPTDTCRASLDGASFVVPPPSEFTDLPLAAGWQNGVSGTPTAAVAHHGGVTYFRGALSGGSGTTLFTLPVALRPETNAYVSADLCLARQGRLVIAPTGDVTVQTDAASSFADAQCFTSLEGVKYTRYATGFTPLSLASGWGDQPYGTSRASAARIDGIVHLKGAVYGGTDDLLFTLPPGLRPDASVYLSVNLCGSAKGRIFIATNGEARVFAPSFADAQCFVSLDGVSFTTSANALATLAPVNGWTGAPFATAPPAATIVRNVVHLRGGLAGGASGSVFTLPPLLRPPSIVYVPADLLAGRKGRLIIEPSGAVSVSPLNSFSDAQSFTSLDGVSYAVPEPAVFPALVGGIALIAMTRCAGAREVGGGRALRARRGPDRIDGLR